MVTNSTNKGFTLTELLVVLAIMGILSAVIVLNYRVGGEQLKLHRAAHKLAQDIRRVSEMVMSAKEIDPNDPNKNFVPEGGYGIRLKTSPAEIFLFADCDEDRQYKHGNHCGSPSNKFREKLEDLSLESDILINSLSPSSPLDIVFVPPNPTIYINGSTSTEAVIVICLNSDHTKQKTIKVNSAGLIKVE